MKSERDYDFYLFTIVQEFVQYFSNSSAVVDISHRIMSRKFSEIFLYLFLVILHNSLYLHVASEPLQFTLISLQGNEISTDDVDISKPQYPTRLLIHDWAHSDQFSIQALQKHYEISGPHDLLILNWTRTELFPNQTNIGEKVSEIGCKIANKLLNMNKTSGLQLNDLGIVGYGMGAHLAGKTGHCLKNISNFSVEMIFGLDPSRDLEEMKKDRLNRENARAVVVLHTNVNVTGVYEPIGHTDIYANEMTSQWGCRINDNACSHAKAVEFFTDIVNAKLRKCNGIPWDQDKQCTYSQWYQSAGSEDAFVGEKFAGIYYLQTYGRK